MLKITATTLLFFKQLIKNKTMKKILIIIFSGLIVSTLIFTSCKKNSENPPTLTTTEILIISNNSVVCETSISSTGSSPIIEKGFVCSTSQNPTIENQKSLFVLGDSLYISKIDNLMQETTYYIRGYATNEFGVSYGNELTFTTTEPFIDNRDNNIYQTVKIGNQIWLSENLKYLPAISEPSTSSQSQPYYYVYDYFGSSISDAKLNSNYSSNGVLYNWSAANMACPSGWHLPSDSEWDEMETYLADKGFNVDGTFGNPRSKSAKAIASNYGWSTNLAPSTPYYDWCVGTTFLPEYRNLSCFSGLPSGSKNIYDDFSGSGEIGSWWTSTEADSNKSWAHYIHYAGWSINRNDVTKELGFSVRCIKD